MPTMFELRDFLGDAPARRFTRRARLRGTARVSFRPGEWQLYRPWLGSPAPLDPFVTVIDSSQEALWRVMYETEWHRLLLWVDVEDVLIVAKEPVLVQLEPGPRALSRGIVTGVEVQPGCFLKQRNRTPLWVEVKGGDWRFDFEGWVPWAVFGNTFAAWNRSLIKANARVRTRADVELYESARGGVLGTFRNNQTKHSIRILGRSKKSMTPIRYQGDLFEATGFMDRKHILVDRNAPSGYGYGSAHAKHAVVLNLPEGTCLYSDKDGEAVGVCLASSTAAVDRVEDGWWHIPCLWMGWRTFDVWVQDDGPAPAERTSSSHRIIYRRLQRCEP